MEYKIYHLSNRCNSKWWWTRWVMNFCKLNNYSNLNKTINLNSSHHSIQITSWTLNSIQVIWILKILNRTNNSKLNTLSKLFINNNKINRYRIKWIWINITWMANTHNNKISTPTTNSKIKTHNSNSTWIKIWWGTTGSNSSQ